MRIRAFAITIFGILYKSIEILTDNVIISTAVLKPNLV